MGAREGDEALARDLTEGRAAAGLDLAEPDTEAGVMAGSGTAALRERDDILLSVERLWSSTAPVRAARSTPSPTSASTSPAARRSVLSANQLWQVHDWAGDHDAVPGPPRAQ